MDSNFQYAGSAALVELAVAAAIAVFGLESGGAGDCRGVLVEVPGHAFRRADPVAHTRAGTRHVDGTQVEFELADVIDVNAGATRPADPWLERLNEAGRQILPVTADGFPNRDLRF